MSAMASVTTISMIVYSNIYSGADQRNFKAPRHWPLWGEFTGNRWIPPQKGPVTRKMSPFGDVIMLSLFLGIQLTTSRYRVVAWCQTGHRPSPEPMMTQWDSSLTHICVTRPRWIHSTVVALFDLRTNWSGHPAHYIYIYTYIYISLVIYHQVKSLQLILRSGTHRYNLLVN